MADDRKPKETQGLPEGWKWVRLGEVIEDTYPGEWGDNPTDTDSKNIFPVFSTLAIDYDGRIDFTKAVPRKLNKKKIEKLKLKKGMILIEKSGGSTDTPAGKVAILKQDFEGTCSNFIQILKPNNNTCNSYYLFYRLLYNFKNNIIEKYQQRTTGIINFILKDYFNEYIPLPPLPEQQKIAEILETIDNSIEKTDKIIEKYKRIKQGLMQDLLTKGIDENGNIRSEKTHKFKDSPLGRIPEEWEVVRLGEILKFLKGKTPRKLYDYEEEGMTIYLTPEYLRKNKCDVAFCKKEETLLANEDIIILWDGSNAGEVFWAEKGAVASTMAKIDITSSDFPIYKKFLYYYLKSNEFVFKYQVKGSGIPHFEKDILNTLNSVFPPLSEQKRIAEILSQIDQAIEKEEKYKQKLERLKKGLMEDLLTGKVRVNKLLEGENHGMA